MKILHDTNGFTLIEILIATVIITNSSGARNVVIAITGRVQMSL
jgi:prepilin-type N-terminal cleavage/methylation domain-containing protein